MKSFPFLIPLFVGCIVQFMKICIDYYNSKNFNVEQLWVAGGFPSVHSAFSSSVMTLVGLKEGLDSSLFVVASIFSLLFRYDAMNVRYESGKHAKYINQLKFDLKNVLQEQVNFVDLKERIGHTPFEVAGGIIIGSILTVVFYFCLLV